MIRDMCNRLLLVLLIIVCSFEVNSPQEIETKMTITSFIAAFYVVLGMFNDYES